MCKVLYFVIFLRQVATGHLIAKKKNKLYISYVLQIVHKKSIHIKCDYLKKRKNLFKNDFFKENVQLQLDLKKNHDMIFVLPLYTDTW